MKAIALVMVQGGVAYPYAPEHVDVRVIDRDSIEAGDSPVFLPRGIGFEELADQAGLIEGVDFDWWRNEGHQSANAAPDLLDTLKELRAQLRAHIKFDVKKHYSLMVADAAAGTAIAKAELGQ